MKRLRTKEVKIGISVIAAIIILVFGLNFLKGVNLLRPGNYYYINFENIEGLALAAPVTIEGFKVGQVREIEFDYDNPGKVKVMLNLNKKLRIPDDSYAKLSSSLLNGGFIEIKLGRSKRMIEVGGYIDVEQNKDLFKAISEDMVPSAISILPKVDSLLISLNHIATDPAILSSIHNFDGIMTNLYSTSADLNVITGKDLPILMRNVNRMSTGVDTLIRNLGTLSYQLKSIPLNKTVDNINQLTSNLTEFSNQLNDKNSTIGKLTTDPELYTRINRIAADLDTLIVDIKKNPKRYVTIKVF